MRIYILTRIGEAISSSPVSNPSDARKVLYFMRRKGGRATDEEIKEFVVDGSQMHTTMNKLIRVKAVTVVG